MEYTEIKASRPKLLLMAGLMIVFLVSCGLPEEEKIKTVRKNCEQLSLVFSGFDIQKNCVLIIVDTDEFLRENGETLLAVLASKTSEIRDSGYKMVRHLLEPEAGDQQARQPGEPFQE